MSNNVLYRSKHTRTYYISTTCTVFMWPYNTVYTRTLYYACILTYVDHVSVVAIELLEDGRLHRTARYSRVHSGVYGSLQCPDREGETLCSLLVSRFVGRWLDCTAADLPGIRRNISTATKPVYKRISGEPEVALRWTGRQQRWISGKYSLHVCLGCGTIYVCSNGHRHWQPSICLCLM